jgi:3-hydroxyisobutyrate dehydrogenase
VLALVEGLAETIALAEALGVDPATFLEIIDGGPLARPTRRSRAR